MVLVNKASLNFDEIVFNYSTVIKIFTDSNCYEIYCTMIKREEHQNQVPMRRKFVLQLRSKSIKRPRNNGDLCTVITVKILTEINVNLSKDVLDLISTSKSVDLSRKSTEFIQYSMNQQ